MEEGGSGYGVLAIVLATGLLLCAALFLRVGDSPVREIAQPATTTSPTASTKDTVTGELP